VQLKDGGHGAVDLPSARIVEKKGKKAVGDHAESSRFCLADGFRREKKCGGLQPLLGGKKSGTTTLATTAPLRPEKTSSSEVNSARGLKEKGGKREERIASAQSSHSQKEHGADFFQKKKGPLDHTSKEGWVARSPSLSKRGKMTSVKSRLLLRIGKRKGNSSPRSTARLTDQRGGTRTGCDAMFVAAPREEDRILSTGPLFSFKKEKGGGGCPLTLALKKKRREKGKGKMAGLPLGRCGGQRLRHGPRLVVLGGEGLLHGHQWGPEKGILFHRPRGGKKGKNEGVRSTEERADGVLG